MNGDVAIRAKALRQVFGQGANAVVALDRVTLDLKRGELTLLMGPSGSGKSSLIAALGGLQVPTDGDVIVGEQSLWSKGRRQINRFRREQCGFVFQSGGLFPSLTALKQVAIPLTYIGVEKRQAYRKAREVLEEVGLGDRIDSLPGEMSGGQNQRVAIARMLSKDPNLVFCDEPTSALDSENGAVVANLLRREARSRQAMILCVTHDDRLRRFADRILQIRDGQIVQDSQTEKEGVEH